MLLAAVVAVALARPDSKYTTKYDNVDLDEIIKNDRLMQNYVKCLLEKGNCSPDGAELKSKYPPIMFYLCKLSRSALCRSRSYASRFLLTLHVLHVNQFRHFSKFYFTTIQTNNTVGDMI